jgi:hypothetical protein
MGSLAGGFRPSFHGRLRLVGKVLFVVDGVVVVVLAKNPLGALAVLLLTGRGISGKKEEDSKMLWRPHRLRSLVGLPWPLRSLAEAGVRLG